MENNPALEDLREFATNLEKDRADRKTTELAQRVLAVFDWFETRLDVLDEREGA